MGCKIFCNFSCEIVHFGVFYGCFKGSDAVTPSGKSSINTNRMAEGRGDEGGYGGVSTYLVARGRLLPLPPIKTYIFALVHET